MIVFRKGNFRLHSGSFAKWKIDLDNLDAEDFEVLAMLGARLVGAFGSVSFIPRGGRRLAEAIVPYRDSSGYNGPVLIVDDVLTTGSSMEEARDKEVSHPLHPFTKAQIKGLVAFARGPVPSWVKTIFIYAGDEP